MKIKDRIRRAAGTVGILSAAAACMLFPGAALAESTENDQNQSNSNQSDSKDGDSVILPEERVNGYIPVEKEFYRGTPAAGTGETLLKDELPEEELPGSYRSDKEEWAANLRVKDQMRTGLCWAFSMTSAAEYSYAKEYYETTGQVLDNFELSAAHLGYFFYNRADDPLNNTEYDYNDYPQGQNWALIGGNQVCGMQAAAGWTGMAEEAKAPIQEVNKHIYRTADRTQYWDGSQVIFPDRLAYDDAAVQEEAIMYYWPEKELMKQLILKYGAVSASMEFNYAAYMNLDEINPETGKPYDTGRSYYNYSSNFSPDHALTVIGWDDSYPKENFAHLLKDRVKKDANGKPLLDDQGQEILMTDEECLKLTTPQKDGAWIILNSWGKETHENGVLYVSYETVDFNLPAQIFAFDMMSPDTYKYNFFYDGNGSPADSADRTENKTRYDYWTRPGTHAANVFTNTTGEPVSIDAVGFTTFTPDHAEYTVDIYTGLTDPEDPASGTHAGTSRVSSDSAGCKTVKLDQPVAVRPGETWSVVFTFDDFNAFGVETNLNGGFLTCIAQIDKGQSFFCAKNSSEWLDMSGYSACFRIKAFANPCEMPETFEPGWNKKDGQWYYLDEDGEPVKGWLKDKGKWYYLDEEIGSMTVGWTESDGAWYYLKPDGSMAANEWCRGYWLNKKGIWSYQPRGFWKKNGRGWWYGDTSGWYAKKQWQRIDGKWYYFDEEGYMVTGTREIDGVSYTFDDSGAWVR